MMKVIYALLKGTGRILIVLALMPIWLPVLAVAVVMDAGGDARLGDWAVNIVELLIDRLYGKGNQ